MKRIPQQTEKLTHKMKIHPVKRAFAFQLQSPKAMNLFAKGRSSGLLPFAAPSRFGYPK